ncbi:MAG: iron ABC transporter permease [Candidatus Methanomethylophilus sp.]|nr:iron ABC transporter permease [Methanomethylophilus sp.]
MIFLLGCILVVGISLSFNGRGLNILECYSYLFKHILGATYEFRSEDYLNDFMVWNVYTPRIAMAIVTGCGLAVCGVIMQSILANPLADPYTTGVSDGATLGATAAIVTGLSFSGIAGSMGIVTNAFIGAIIPAVILIFLSSALRMTPATCILIGTALSGIFSGLQTLMLYGVDADHVTSALRWGIGTFSQTQWSDVTVPAIIMFAGAIASMFLYKQLNLLTTGDKTAKSLGVDVEKLKSICMILVSFVAAAIICYTGVIGFVGLLAPHMVRMILGGDNKYVIPAAMLVGAVLLLASDMICRIVVYPDELRAGLIMSAIGAPIFLYMIVRRKKGYGEVYRCRSPTPTRRRSKRPSTSISTASVGARR